MAMSGANYDRHFANLGKIVKLYDDVQGWIDAVQVIEAEYAAIAKDDEDEILSLKRYLAITRSFCSSLRSYQRQLASEAKAYIKAGVRKDLGFTGSSINTLRILEDLTEDMGEASESCDASAVAVANLAYDADNIGNGLLATPSSLSQLLTDEAWELECKSIAGGGGAETWEVRGEPDEHGRLAAALVSNVSYEAVDRNSQALFTLIVTAYVEGTGYEIAGDVDGELAAYTFSGAIWGTNTDALGDVYIDLDQLAAAEAGDQDNQLSGWDNITGLELGKNTDAAGVLHAYVNKQNGTANIRLYRDAALTEPWLVAHTAIAAPGVLALVEDYNSGIGGTITLDAVVGDDTTITYTYAFDRVRVYKEVGKTNLVCTGGVVGGAVTNLYEQNSSGLTGVVTTTYDDGETGVQVRIGFAFAVGDKIYFDTTSDEAGTFVEFFRKELGVAPETDAVGGETIDDAWAE